MARPAHLPDDRLFDCYLAERGHQVPDPPLAEHLGDCPDCSARYEALIRFMETLRREADAQADEIFTADRLRAQQARIAKRIEQAGRAARVISFPRSLVTGHMTGAAGHGATRWVYAAAAAGLVIGVALGAVYDSQWRATAQVRRAHLPRFSVPSPIRFTPVAADGVAPTPDASDDLFLSELELALERPRTRALLPFDALTPHVRPVSENLP